MLRIAVQSKGRLYDETMLLLEEAGIKLNRGKRILLLSWMYFRIGLPSGRWPMTILVWYL